MEMSDESGHAWPVSNLSLAVGAGASIPGYFAVPKSGSGPGVIVVQEWWGLVPHIEAVCRRLADAGFVALAIDHYRGEKTTEPDEAGKLMLGLRIADVGHDIAVAADWLADRVDTVGDKVGIVGFCMGGGLALLGPTVSTHIDRVAAFYPAMPWPDYAPAWARYAGASAIVHKAESDEPSTGERIAEYVDAIRAHGGDATVYDYPGSVHAFFNDDRPEVYQRDHAELAWERTVDFLRRD